MTLKAGTRLKSAVCETEVIVVRAPDADVDLRCGGAPMIEFEADRPAGGSPTEAHGAGTLLGKRYADEDTGIEVLCTKAGQGSLAVGDLPLPLKEAKPLPASD
ncbi:MAG: hypothetical protein ACLPVF_08260 [Acidimicrobiales bacterium]